MRHGRKSQHHRFDGYKLSASATDTPEPLITAVSVASGNEPDGPQAAKLIDTQPVERRPRRVLGDTAYGIGPVRAELAARRRCARTAAIRCGARRAPRETRLHDRPGRWHRDLPAGAVAPIQTEPSGDRRARFRRGDCVPCALRDRCAQPVKGVRTIGIEAHKELLIAARTALDDPATAEHLRRRRPRIERLLSVLSHRYGARKCRYIGRKNAELQAAWTAALVNLNPISRKLAATIA
jgi:Transposase DDE domain